MNVSAMCIANCDGDTAKCLSNLVTECIAYFYAELR